MMDDIRIIARETIKNDRKKFREAFLDHLRKDCETEATSSGSSTKMVTSIADKLKIKSHVPRKELAFLKNLLLENEMNTSAFLKVSGALRGLVRELTGNDASKQISSAACCCNLSLGPIKSCFAVAKAAGPYLISYLQSMNKELAMTSAWALGNLSASDPKICKMLNMQGAILKLVNLLEESDDSELIDSIAYALAHYLRTSEDFEHVNTEKVVVKIMNSEVRSMYTYWLVYLLTSREDFYKVNFWYVIKLYDDLVVILKDANWEHNVTSVECILRTLANCCDNMLNCNIFLNYITQNSGTENTLTKMFACSNPQLKADLMWVLGNIFNFASDTTEKNRFFIEVGNIVRKTS